MQIELELVDSLFYGGVLWWNYQPNINYEILMHKRMRGGGNDDDCISMIMIDGGGCTTRRVTVESFDGNLF